MCKIFIKIIPIFVKKTHSETSEVLVHLKNIESPVFGVKTCLNVKEIEKFENYIYTIGSIKETAVYSN